MKKNRVTKKVVQYVKRSMPHNPQEAIQLGLKVKKYKGMWDGFQRRLQPLKTLKRVVDALRLFMEKFGEGLKAEGMTVQQALPDLKSRNPWIQKLLKYMKVQ